MATNQNVKNQENDDELVAYLDGELEGDRADAIEARLSDDPAFRTRLAKLQKTWDMLDSLPRPQKNENFTRSTLELVVSDAKREIRKRNSTVPAWIKATGLLFLVGTLGLVTGFFVVDRVRNQPQRDLINNLELIENVNEYLSIDNVEFLKLLDEEELFVDESDEADIESNQPLGHNNNDRNQPDDRRLKSDSAKILRPASEDGADVRWISPPRKNRRCNASVEFALSEHRVERDLRLSNQFLDEKEFDV